MVFDASRRLYASTCKSLGSPFSIERANVGAGLLADLGFPALLDLALAFGGGSDDGLVKSCGGLPCIFLAIRLVAASLVSCEK